MAKLCAASFLILIVAAAATSLRESRSLAREEVATLKERPVMKVVRLLQDMKAQLEREGEDDKQVYKKITCWCETNGKEKDAAIELGVSTANALEASMSEDAAKVVELRQKRESAWQEIQRDDASLKKASAMRSKENSAFHSEEMNLMEAVRACKQAIEVLSVHHPQLAQVKSIAQDLQKARVPELVASTLSRSKMEELKSFLFGAQGAASFLAIPGFQSAAPQSGQIFGILKQMLSDFESNLSDSQKAEMKAQSEFVALRTAKQEEIASGQELVSNLDQQIANLGEKAAREAKEFEDTNKQLGMDRAFLADLQSKCATRESDYDARSKSRLEEIQAVDDTIKILNSDESFDNFDKTVNSAALFQVKSEEGETRRRDAAALLRKAAAATGAPRLSLLAASLKLDAFTKVKAEIDKLVAELLQQQEDEVAHRDWCTTEKHVNKGATEESEHQRDNLRNRDSELTETIKVMNKQEKNRNGQMAEMQVQMTRASSSREAEHQDAHQTIEDQRLTQMILKKAVTRMSEVYGFVQEPEQPGAAHIATSGTHTDAGNAPARFNKYDQNTGGNRVVMMLNEVLADSQALEDKAVREEADAQTAYDNFMQASNKSLKQMMAANVDLTGARASSKLELNGVKQDSKATMVSLENLSSELGDLSKACNWVVDNFDARQEARAAEVESLRNAKAILSGSDLAALQK